MLRKNYSLILFLVSFLFLTSFVSAVTVNVTTEPASYYSDTKDVNLVIDYSELSQDTTYNWTTSEADFDLDDCWGNPQGFCVYGNKTLITLAYKSGIAKYVFSLLSPNIRTEDEFSFSLTSGSPPVCQLSSCPQTQSFPVLNGSPTFSVSLYDVNSKQEGVTAFPKANSFQIKIIGLKDNIDDSVGDYISCTYTVKQINTTKKTANSNGWTANLTPQNKDWDIISASDIGQGDYTLEVVCKDKASGGLSTTKNVNFKVEDKLPKVDSITFSPEKIYPDTKVTCNAIISDEDDPASLDKTFAWKFKGQSTTNTTNQFDCTTNKCVSGDTLTCIVTPKNNQTGQSATKETTVQSYFSNVKISAPSKVQVSQEASLTADVTYTGKGTITYNWTFGDGSSGTGKSVKHTYTSKGEFTVTLTVNDGKNSSGETTATISVVDADLIISIKSPVTNQEVTKGEALNIKVGLNDNTGTPINDANVTAIIKSGDKNYNTATILKPVSNTPGLYETNLTVGYLIPTQSEIEVSANYNKGTIKMFNKKSVPVSLTPFDNVLPTFEMETAYAEQNETELTVGNTINKLLVCFALPAGNGFDNAMAGTKLIIESSSTLTYDLKELEGSCYATYPNYKVSKQDLDNAIAFKFKDPKDIYGNYVKASFAKTYAVKKGKDVFDAILLEPNSDKINVGEKINVKVKVTPTAETKLNEIKNITATVTYLDKTIKLSALTEGNSNEKIFAGEFEQDPSLTTVSFKVNVQGEYKESVVEQEIKKTLSPTNQLNAEMISPAENGSFDEFGKIILNVKYEDGKNYDGNDIALTVNDQNLLFEKILFGSNAGFFETETNQVGFFKSANLNFKGSDAKGNILNYSATVPTMAWKMPMFVYYILLGILVVLGVMFVFLRKTAKTVESISKGRSIEELKDALAVAKSTLSELQRKYFKQEISEDVFKTQKIPYEKQILQLEGQIKVYEKQENQLHEDAKDFVENKMPENQKKVLEQKLNLQTDLTNKYKEEIDNLVARLKPYKNKFSEIQIRMAIKQEKVLPEDVVNKIVRKVFE